jgi:hypothetical protein
VNAFHKYLLSIPKEQAAYHLYECMRGSNGELAWDFLEEFRGESWSCPPEKILHYLADTVDLARAYNETLNNGEKK